MKYFGGNLSEKHKELSKIIRNDARLEQSKELFLEIHAALNSSKISGSEPNEMDALFDGLLRADYAVMPTAKDETIAWVLWHIARIEDLTMNVMIAKGEQIFNDEWQNAMNASMKDTGNAMSDEEIFHLSETINIEKLKEYRNEVAKRTRQIVSDLKSGDMKRKVDVTDLKRIHQCGGVTNQEDSIWLLEFWGKKDVAGLLLMPPTRHVMMHLNDCGKWKEYILKKRLNADKN